MQLSSEVFTEQEQEDYILLVMLGLISPTNLSDAYHLRISDTFRNGLREGFGDVDDETPEAFLLALFTKNISTFAAAKQFQQVRDMSSFLGLDKEEFLTKARAIFKEYNEHWLATEYETVVNTARAGRAWVGFEKERDNRPYLTYHTQRDNRVRPEHAILEGITRPVGDPFWSRYAPPNGWNCRCFLTSSVNAQVTSNRDIPLKRLNKEVPAMFQTNPAKTGMVFNNMHPYFSVAPLDRSLRRNNFNLARHE